MDAFNYTSEAELFAGRGRKWRSQSIGYTRFACAAEAIQFAIEQLPHECLAGSYLQIDDERFNGAAIRQLYESADYPLSRPLVTPTEHVPARTLDAGRRFDH